MKIEGPNTRVNKSQEELFNFLTAVANYEKIMPENIQKFEILGDNKFLFQLKGMPEIGLKIQEQKPNDTVVLGSISDKFAFSLTGNITATTDAASDIQLIFAGEFNSMMAMMIKSPLKKFVNTLSENLGKL
ncbi:MAG: SRPBCC family protein [Mesonia hippocampi]|uniref:SRPBCC family protein n=1 Tax=Mesonia hippocampi TaxID=1628250 RepID=UPI003F9BA58E